MNLDACISRFLVFLSVYILIICSKVCRGQDPRVAYFSYQCQNATGEASLILTGNFVNMFKMRWKTNSTEVEDTEI